MISSASQQQHIMINQVQPVMQPMQASPMEKYKTYLYNFGITEIVLGAISCALGALAIIIGLNYYVSLTFVGQGIWCGGVLIVCGVLGLMTRTRPTRCMYNANMAMSIVAANFMIVMVILSGMAAAFDSNVTSIVIFHSVICLAGFGALIITILHSAYCCAGVCCLESYPRQVVVVGPNGMIPVQLPNGQTVLYPQPTGYSSPHLVFANPTINMPTTRIGFGPPPTQSIHPNYVMPIGQTVQSTSSIQAPVYSSAPPMYTTNSPK